MSKISNLIHQKTTDSGTGNLSLSPVKGRRAFYDAFGIGGTDVFFYSLTHAAAGEWEIGTGHMADAATLARDTVISSSNAGAPVNFSIGAKDAVNDLPASYQARLETLAPDLSMKAL